MFKLKTTKKSGIRQGEIVVRGKKLATPAFMPDATRGFVKLLSPTELKLLNLQALVVNTFHLYLQPGIDIVKKAGGMHKFMNYPGLLLSDSGGFQVFSLIHRSSQMGKITDEKATFKSPIDGSWHELTPEKSIQIQFDLGVDMMVCLDDCPPNDFSRDDLEKAVTRTIAWAKRCRVEYDKQVKKRKLTEKNRPLIFGVIQGGAELDLRARCAKELIALDFDGYGFGARPVDMDGNFLEEVLRYTAALIPKNKIRFALGIGTPEDIKRCAALGWDLFDCVIPTREGRHGRLFMKKGKGYEALNINNSRFSKDFKAINSFSKILELKSLSKAYLYNLFKHHETLGQRIASLNNLEFYQNLMKGLRGK